MLNLNLDLKRKILNDPSLDSKQDVKNISEVCRAFRDCKEVPKWDIRTNVLPNIFMRVGNRCCSVLDLRGCDLEGITVPESLPDSLKELDLNSAKNIPSELINLALRSLTIEKLDLESCDLEGISVPESLPALLKVLNLDYAKNIPPELINRALQSSTIEKLILSLCDLDEISVPESLPTSLKELDLSRAKNIPTELITKARACPNCDVVLTN